MQGLCPRPRLPRRALIRLGMLLSLLGLSLPSTAGASPSVSAQALSKSAQAWVQAQSTEPIVEVRLAPLDARVTVVDCAEGWQFDLPYASRETLRARCEQPRQQLFLRIQPSGPMKAPSRSEPSAVNAAGAVSGGPVQRVALQTRPGDALAPAAPAAGGVALVLRRDQARGARLAPDLVDVLEVDASGAPGLNLRQTKDLEFMELTRAMRAGETLRTSDLKPAQLVRRGQSVTMKIGTPGQFLVEVRLESLQDGQHGERIRLKNRESGRILTGRVIGDSAVLPD
jgi:flagella basal body P-ring formation protein FlgA